MFRPRHASRSGRRFPGMAVGWLLLAICCATPALAIVRDIEPGTVPRLAADEALLVIAVDTNQALDAVRLVREGGQNEMKTVRGLDSGRSLRLVSLPAGRYRWSSLELERFAYSFKGADADEYTFEVRAGRINYPGELIYRAEGQWGAMVHISNRGLIALDWMQAKHPGVLPAFAFEYTGRYPDPFPAFYREALGKQAPPADRSAPAPAAGALPLPIATLWREGQLNIFELNRSGDMLAQVLRIEREGRIRWSVELTDLATGKTARLTESHVPVSRLDWAGDRMLVISQRTHPNADTLLCIEALGTSEQRKYRAVIAPRVGRLVSVLRDEPGRILFQSELRISADPVHKLDLRDSDALQKFRFRDGDRLDRGMQGAWRWFADGAGHLRAAILPDRKGARMLMHGRDGDYRAVLNLDEDDDFWPLALSADGERIYGTAERGRGQRELVEFDPGSGRIVRTLFSLPGVDVEAPLFDAAGALIGASHFREGLLTSVYFDEGSAGIEPQLRSAFPGLSTAILQRDANARRYLLYVGGGDTPASVHLYDRAHSKAQKIADERPWLADMRFASSRTLRARSRDGLEIEAYLTLPQGTGKHPLIVLPHGGPIGVRDDRYFNPEVQFLASLGYAVLQVNFRGSEGFGTAFRKAGERNYGSAIEDDIDAALAAALAEFPLDEKRMCAMGASYGGYSALVSSIRWPGRFRCAISMFGISDRALFFTASDSARSAAVRKTMEAYIGNPHTDMDEMLRYSPLYRYRELTTPVMLVHGGEDYRVDYEHTRRLLRMLNLDGRPPVLIELKEEGHGIDDDANRQRVWEAVAGFLRAHLGGTAAARTADKR